MSITEYHQKHEFMHVLWVYEKYLKIVSVKGEKIKIDITKDKNLKS